MEKTEKDQILIKIDNIYQELDYLSGLIAQKKFESRIPNSIDIRVGRSNYAKFINSLTEVMAKIRNGIERDYFLPLPVVPDTSHWEIKNEFIKYFISEHDVLGVGDELPPGFKSSRRADLFFETSDGKWFWVEVQTSLTNDAIERKINDAINITNNDRYAEYILIFPQKFKTESLFLSTRAKIKGNPGTNKLRLMLYSEGNFETELEPGERKVEKGSFSELLGESL